jgi:sister chromatid cohesion protein DCC1
MEGIESGGLDASETVTTIAKCGSTLELHIPPEGFSAVPFLEKALELYDRLSWEGGTEMTPAERRMSREKLFTDIPVSTAQCQSGWDELCAFVYGDDDDARSDQAVCWRPSAMVKLAVWKRMFEGSVLQGIDLEKQFLARDLWKAVLDDDDEEPFPRPLFDAILTRLLESPGANESEIKCKHSLTIHV